MEIRAGFHKKLREIQDDILIMGSMVSKAGALVTEPDELATTTL